MPNSPNLLVWLKEANHILNFISAIGAPGGVWFLIDKYRNRIKVRIRKLRIPFSDTTHHQLELSAENISSTPTSFEPKFIMTGYAPGKEKLSYEFIMLGDSRQLPISEEKEFNAWCKNLDARIFYNMLFMKFKFKLSRGQQIIVRVPNSKFEQDNFFRFYAGLLKFLLFRNKG